MKIFWKIVLIILIIATIISIASVGYGFYLKATRKIQNPVATIEVQDYGTIKVELYPDIAPNTVSNFIALANNGFYDNLTFHRIVKGFMIQGGDKTGDGTGSPSLSDLKEVSSSEDKKYAIKGEFIANNYSKNNMKFERGVIAMSRSDNSSLSSSLTKTGYNSAGSQLFIMHEDNFNLNGLYAAFGKVIEGMDVVDKIAETEVKPAESEKDEASTPVNAPVITKITVETYGVDYGLPETNDTFDYYSWLMKQYNNNNSSK